MNTQIDDITLLKSLGKGSYGEVFLSTKKGKKEYFATKKMERKKIDQPNLKKYFENEVKLLRTLRHPNIVQLEDLKMTRDNYYLVMEYINGGSLTDCLKSYQKKHGKSFPEEIVQHLMKQIVSAIKYIHGLNIIHRDLKLDNIMVKFDTESDKSNINMMRAKIKVIDFGFAIQLTKSSLTFTALGSPINMDPVILQKFSNRGIDINQVGYDSKADIWSLGTICYEMLIGQAVFNAQTLKDLVTKVENGSYSVPTTVSREVVSFLNGMLQYKGEKRLSADELWKHPFLTKNVNEFTKINTRKISKKMNNNKELNINVKNNQTIWAIFNEDDENQLKKIKGSDYSAPDGPINEEYNPRKRAVTDKNIPKMNNKIQQQKKNVQQPNQAGHAGHAGQAGNYHKLSNDDSGVSFYGHNMYPNMNMNMNTNMNRINNEINEMEQRFEKKKQMMMQQMGYPQMQIREMPYSPMMNFPTSGVQMGYPYSGVYIVNPKNNVPNNNKINNIRKYAEIEDEMDICSIQ